MLQPRIAEGVIFMDYEEYKESRLSLIENLQTSIKERLHRKAQFEAQNDERKARGMDGTIKSLQSRVTRYQEEMSLSRPEKQEDIAERKRIQDTYAKEIASSIPEDKPVFFHGVKSLTSLEAILASGHLGYLEDETTSSFTSPGSVDVTTRNNIETSLNFMGLETYASNAFIPAGCMFVIAPKDEDEKAYAMECPGTEHHIETVYFAQNPERLVAIVSTTENQEYIKKMVEKYGISPDKVCTFDGFIERMQNENGKVAGSLKKSLSEICQPEQRSPQQKAILNEAAKKMIPTQ